MKQVSNVYERFANNLGEIADRWSHNESLPTGVTPGTRQAFEHMSDKTLQRVAWSHPSLTRFGPDALGVGVLHGMNVIARFHYLSATRAKYEGLTIEAFEPIIRHPESAEQLTQIAQNPNKVAGRTERDYGLADGSSNADDDAYIAEQHYRIEDGAIQLKGLQTTLARHLLIASQNEAFVASGQCDAHRAGALLHIYEHMTTIALKDPSLTIAILGLRHQSSS